MIWQFIINFIFLGGGGQDYFWRIGAGWFLWSNFWICYLRFLELVIFKFYAQSLLTSRFVKNINNRFGSSNFLAVIGKFIFVLVPVISLAKIFSFCILSKSFSCLIPSATLSAQCFLLFFKCNSLIKIKVLVRFW